jgi:soluble lytic murein transglycosylase-like protein
MRYARYVLALLLLSCSASYADIYGYVDDKGVAHTSTEQIDARYYLFKKEPAPAATLPVEATPALVTPATPPTKYGKRYIELISRVATEVRVDAALIHAVVAAESAYNARALSRAGAMGLMQLMPATALRYGVGDAWDPLQNLRGGARYLRDLLLLFQNDLRLVLAAYNAGEGAVIQHGYKIPPYAETRVYVPKVLQLLQQQRLAL